MLGEQGLGIVACDPVAYLDTQARHACVRHRGRGVHRSASSRATRASVLASRYLTMTGTELRADASAIAELGMWIPISNGDPLSPEILFDSNGDVIMGFVPTP